MSDILNCGAAKQQNKLVRFTYQCPREWQALQQTENNSIHFCDACQENVFYCTNKEEAEEHALQGHCIAIASKLTTAVDFEYNNSTMIRGRVAKTALPKRSQAWAKDIFSQI